VSDQSMVIIMRCLVMFIIGCAGSGQAAGLVPSGRVICADGGSGSSENLTRAGMNFQCVKNYALYHLVVPARIAHALSCKPGQMPNC